MDEKLFRVIQAKLKEQQEVAKAKKARQQKDYDELMRMIRQSKQRH